MPRTNKLTVQQQKFVKEYVAGCTPERAAKLAGYSDSVCKTGAYSFINKPHIKAEIERQSGVDLDGFYREDVTDVIMKMKMMIDFNIHDFMVIDEDGRAWWDFRKATKDDWYCIQEMALHPIAQKHCLSGDEDGDRYPLEAIKLKAPDKKELMKLYLQATDNLQEKHVHSIDQQTSNIFDRIADVSEKASPLPSGE